MSMVFDSASERIVLAMLSASGIEIEELAEQDPEAMVTGSGELTAEKIEIMRECRIAFIERPLEFGTAIAKMI